MPTVHITRRERFSAAHKLSRPDWSAERNLATFGKCANPNWHGHNYELWVTVAGEPSTETGFVADLAELGRLMKLHVVDKLDHRNLDLDVDFMKGSYTITENLALPIWDKLEEPLAALGGRLTCLKLQKTENNHGEYNVR